MEESKDHSRGRGRGRGRPGRDNNIAAGRGRRGRGRGGGNTVSVEDPSAMFDVYDKVGQVATLVNICTFCMIVQINSNRNGTETWRAKSKAQ